MTATDGVGTGAATAADGGGATGEASGAATATDAAATGLAAVGAARSSGGAADPSRRVAPNAHSAPMAAAPITHAAFGRSRTTTTLDSALPCARLSGATEPALCSTAALGGGMVGLERRTNAGGGEESRAPASGARGGATVIVVRTNGGGLTEGKRAVAGAPAACDRPLEDEDGPTGANSETGATEARAGARVDGAGREATART